MASDQVDAGPLSVADEQRLCARIQAGDRSAVEELVLANIRLCTYLAKPYVIDSVDLQDLIQEARLAMLESADTYDASRGRFAHYAGYFIRKALGRFMAEQGATIWMSRHRFQSIALLERAEAELHCVLGREPDDQELCEHLAWKPLVLKRVREAKAIRRTPKNQDLEETITTTGSDSYDIQCDRTDMLGYLGLSVAEQTLAADNSLTSLEHQEDMAKLMRELPKLRPRTRDILMRSMAGESIAQLSREFQLGTDTVKEIIAIGLKQLRQAMGAD